MLYLLQTRSRQLNRLLVITVLTCVPKLLQKKWWLPGGNNITKPRSTNVILQLTVLLIFNLTPLSVSYKPSQVPAKSVCNPHINQTTFQNWTQVHPWLPHPAPPQIAPSNIVPYKQLISISPNKGSIAFSVGETNCSEGTGNNIHKCPFVDIYACSGGQWAAIQRQQQWPWS